MAKRLRHVGAILVIAAVVVGSALFVVWMLRSPDQVRVTLIRILLISLVIFLGILLVRYFTLLWFGYLQHTERNIRGDVPDAELPPVSVVVPAYNEALVIGGAIESILQLDYPLFEVIVVDDGSSDRTLAAASAWEGVHHGVEVRVFSKPNGGKATALNLGIESSHYPFILCMDADSRVEPQLLRQALPHFTDGTVGAVAGNVKVENRGRLLTRLQALEYIEGLNMPRRAQGFIAAVNIVPGPVGVFRREALADVGGYDTDTFAEDADLTLKLVTAGWKIVYEDRAIAWTEAPEGFIDLVQQRYRWTRGILQAVRKRRGVLLRPFPDFPLWLSVLEMVFEAILWPIMNVYAHLFFAVVAVLFGFTELLLYWWILLTLLDLVAALVTVSMEEESLSLVPLAIIYRFFFILFLDVTKALAAVEEFFRFGMEWEKVGRLPGAPGAEEGIA